MTTKKGTNELTPAEQEAERIRRQAQQIDTESAHEQLTQFLCATFSISKGKAEHLLVDEFERPAQRRPKPGANGSIIRETKEGEIKELTVEKYWRENYGEYLPAPKINAGEVAIAQATEAVGSLTVQSILVKEHGPERASELLRLAGGKLGEVVTKPKPGAKAADSQAARDNPWLLDAADAKAQAARIGIITRLGPRVAEGMARAAGKTISGHPLRK